MMQGFTRSRTFRVFRSCNELTGLLQDWTTNRQSARTIDDVFNKLPFTDEKRDLHILEWKTFIIFVNEIIGRKIKLKQVI